VVSENPGRILLVKLFRTGVLLHQKILRTAHSSILNRNMWCLRATENGKGVAISWWDEQVRDGFIEPVISMLRG